MNANMSMPKLPQPQPITISPLPQPETELLNSPETREALKLLETSKEFRVSKLSNNISALDKSIKNHSKIALKVLGNSKAYNPQHSQTRLFQK